MDTTLNDTTGRGFKDNVIPMHADGADGPGGPQPASKGPSGQPQSPPSPPPIRPLVDNGDASVKSRWVWAGVVLALAVIMAALAVQMLLTREPTIIVEMGLGRFAQAARDMPAIRPLVAIAVAAEHLFFAAMLCWMAVLLARDVPVPKAMVGEVIIASARQLRHVRIDWAMKAACYLAVGCLIAQVAEPAMQAAARVMPAVGRVPSGLLLVVAGVLEFMGFQYLVRAVAVYCIPALRAFIVVIAAPLQNGMANRICVGDGRLTRTGRQVIYHEDLVSFVPQISPFRGRVLGLADLQIVFRREGVRQAITLEGPASLRTTQLIADIVNGPWRVAKSRDRTVWQDNSTSIVQPRAR